MNLSVQNSQGSASEYAKGDGSDQMVSKKNVRQKNQSAVSQGSKVADVPTKKLPKVVVDGNQVTVFPNG